MTTIERVITTTSSVPLHTPFVTALRRTETTDTVVVTVTDSDGRTGWGEAPQVWQVTGESLASATACIETMLAPAVTGRRLDDRDDLAAAAALVQRARGPQLRRQGRGRRGPARPRRPGGGHLGRGACSRRGRTAYARC